MTERKVALGGAMQWGYFAAIAAIFLSGCTVSSERISISPRTGISGEQAKAAIAVVESVAFNHGFKRDCQAEQDALKKKRKQRTPLNLVRCYDLKQFRFLEAGDCKIYAAYSRNRELEVSVYNLYDEYGFERDIRRELVEKLSSRLKGSNVKVSFEEGDLGGMDL